MMNVECPWCAGPAAVDLADAGEITCARCGISVEIAPDPVAEPAARAA